MRSAGAFATSQTSNSFAVLATDSDSVLSEEEIVVVHAHPPRSEFAPFEIPVTVRSEAKAINIQARIIDTDAMIDSGCSGVLLNPRFAKESGIPLILKKKPVRLRTIDNSDIKSGLVTHEARVRMTINGHAETISFDVADVGEDNLILGISWLRKHNPLIDWSRATVTFDSDYCRYNCAPKRRRRKTAEPRSAPIPSSFGKKTNTVPGGRAAGTNTEKSEGAESGGKQWKRWGGRRTVLKRELKEEAVRAAKVAIDEALREVLEEEERTPGTSDGRVKGCSNGHSGRRTSPIGGDNKVRGNPPRGKSEEFSESPDGLTSFFFEQTFNPDGDPRVAAGRTFSQQLAEEDRKNSDTPKQEVLVEELVPSQYHDYLDVFSKQKSERLPPHRQYDLGIDLEPGAELPKVGKLYQMSSEELRALKEFIDENLAKGYIRQSKAPCGAPVFFVKKKDGTLRLVVDYRALNRVTRKDAYPIPLTAELLDRLKAAKRFTTLDMRWGYYNVRIRDGDEWKTSFRTRYGQFEFLVMQFGLCNAPAAFQRMVNDLFHDLVDVNVVIYLDDIIIFSENPDEHENHVREVLRRLRSADLYLKPEKCAFDTTSVDYLGLKISPGCIAMDPVKVTGVTKWPTPQNVRHVNQFLGFCNFYRRFIADYADITHPLERLKHKDVRWCWGSEEQEAFDRLKSAFVSAPVLMMPDMEAPFIVETDASDFAMGAVLSQRDESGELRPVAFYSKAMLPAERNYDIYDKELLAIVRALEEWRPYLEGSPHQVRIISDHKNLEYFMTSRDLTRRQARWSLFLNRFWFLIEHRPGRLSGGPDGMSRRPDHESEEPENSARILLSSERLGVKASAVKKERRTTEAVVMGAEMLGESEWKVRATREVRSDAEILRRIRELSPEDVRLKVVFEKENGPEVLRNRLKDWVVDDGVSTLR